MPASVPGRDALRLFAALPLPEDAARALAAWQERELAGARDTRLVAAGNLHLTLAFLGRRPAADVEPIMGVLAEAAARARVPELAPLRYRETRSVGMVVLADLEERATQLADAVGEGLERSGVYRRERRPWLPHVTVLRFRRPPRLSPPLPELPPVRPTEVALFQSVLRPGGAEYGIVQSVALGG